MGATAIEIVYKQVSKQIELDEEKYWKSSQ